MLHFWSKKLISSISQIIPTDWGKITSGGITNIETYGGSRDKQRCLTLVTTKGAVAIPFATTSIIPTEDEIKNANFVYGTYFNDKFNSGYWPTSNTNNNTQNNYDTNKLYPAYIKEKVSNVDGSNGIVYYDISKVTLQEVAVRAIWNITNWAPEYGIPDNYEVTVNNNILTLKYNNEIVLKLN